MKVSVSLAERDVDFLDTYASEHGVTSRSAALQRAVALLRVEVLSEAYVQAAEEWGSVDDARLWDAATADGLD